MVGKNQNPWREAAIGWARREGVPLARRVSGGGTVYHDGGNLNYSLIVSRAGYRQAEVFARTCAALADVGVGARLSAGHSLVAEDKKVSGTAFCFRGAAAMHHGTMLVRADLERLRRALNPSIPEIETRAIPSRPASVRNLADLRPGLTLNDVARALADRLAGGAEIRPYAGPSDASFESRIALHRSRDWVMCYTPSFAWPLCCGRMEVERGRVAQITGPDAPDSLVGQPFDREHLLSVAPAGPWRAAWASRDW